ncbi:MAG: DNA helicase RecQ [Candidatus Omnitrophota bacterium]|nr:DNA helicase RecQ [Candidatus Omnitrophota bacterium]
MKLQELLKRSFGFDSFRPLQREIMEDSLAGRDVFALLPTGGGKSLCYQLPALVRPGLTVVVSPLIALMKDQVDAMDVLGIPATCLNSSLDAGESERRWSRLERGEYRLLYVAPERLMLPGFLQDLRRRHVSLIAVDEAHCISEWGHDFRPEYRRLADVRDVLPDTPILALTATATERVRDDIIRQLRLRNPAVYVAGFNRPNLTYRVVAKHRAYEQVRDYAQARGAESGIVYCQSRKTAERLAERLSAEDIPARPYHAGLGADERNRHQELFLRDEIRVIAATVAFGMGINKPNVRFVIHYDLPKNIEGYYQETGRAGRDGLPAECLLLFGAGDTVKYAQFIEEKSDPNEQAVARRQLQEIVQYAESARCRRTELLGYFGERFQAGHCAACDNCISPRRTFDGTVPAQKFLSCVYRIRERSGFGVGLHHVVEVLTGASTEKVRRWRHEQLSTYGIGTEHTRPEWSAIGRELVRLGLLKQTTDHFSVLELTAEGWAVLKERTPVTLSRHMAPPPASATLVSSPAKRARGEPIRCDETLFERLKRLRKRLADERNVPAYIVFSDVSLRQMASDVPRDTPAFSRISGVGEKKLREFAEVFLAEITAYVEEQRTLRSVPSA